MRDNKPGGNSGPFLCCNLNLTNKRQSRIVTLSGAVAPDPCRGIPAKSESETCMKTKTVSAAALVEFASLLEAKRLTAAAAAAASKAAKVAAEALGLPSESVLLKADDKSAEIAALFTERPVAAIAARVDSFHSFKVTKAPAPAPVAA